MKMLVLLWLLVPTLALGMTLEELSEQLRSHAVVRGSFVQEKHLRALAQPLVSSGRFVLAQEHGLLWLLETPISQRYRINTQGVARWHEQQWQPVPQGGAAAQQRLFLAALGGDVAALQRDFEITLIESDTGWRAELTPRGALLRQIFAGIQLIGAEVVQGIELQEQSGDRTVIRLQAEPATTLAPAEQAELDQ
ncbi:MAG: outer membrane lipoprotein carrier protein LolA [Spongiibacteraceae bacterium]|jgi:hypothetical protein|nr:outer membrane lipoprotein carrier protein LolA [Spongiibacteraceae bacterium]